MTHLHAATVSAAPRQPGGVASAASVAPKLIPDPTFRAGFRGPATEQGGDAFAAGYPGFMSTPQITATSAAPRRETPFGVRAIFRKLMPFRARRIAQLRAEVQWLTEAIDRARKSRSAVVPLYERQRRVTNELLRLGG